MKKIPLALSVSLIIFVLSMNFVSCKKETKPAVLETLNQEPELPLTAYNYAAKHGVNSGLATLGRVLFYDRNLSVNNAVSCGSCHKQEFAFADNVRFNKGFNGIDLKRNSPSIQGIKGFVNTPTTVFVDGTWTTTINTMPDKSQQLPVLLFWDGRQNNLADMVLNPVLNHNEMNLPDFETLIAKLKQTKYYPGLFTNAFGDDEISKERIAYALEGFISCLNTNENGFITNDLNGSNTFNPNQQQQSSPLPANATIEEQGRFLFHNKYNCAQCHDPSNIGSYGTVTTPSQMFNIGLDEVYTDNGLGALTKKAGDQGLFKVPTLKNISLTAPYMHDGRFANLGEVIDHYSHSIKANRNLTSKFLGADGTPKKLNILPAEKAALIAFLNTLKDEDFLTSPMYSDPFKK